MHLHTRRQAPFAPSLSKGGVFLGLVRHDHHPGRTFGEDAVRDLDHRMAFGTLAHLLAYSLITLAVVTLLAAVAGWIVAGRVLRPVHRITEAARAASEHNLSGRVALCFGRAARIRDL